VRNLQVIAFTLNGALGPVFVQLAASDLERLRTAYTVALRTTLLLLVPVAAGGAILSQQIVLLLFGPLYSVSGPVLALSIWSLCFYTLSFVAQTLLVAQGRSVRWFVTLSAGVLLNGALALLLVPRLGAIGASYAALAADGCMLALLLSWTKAAINAPKLLGALMRIGLSTLGMALVVWLLRWLPLWGSVPAGAGTYLALLLLTGAVLPAELLRAAILLPLPMPLRARLQRLAL
jgi:O-antigen/teichoic acid export membrane protein